MYIALQLQFNYTYCSTATSPRSLLLYSYLSKFFTTLQLQLKVLYCSTATYPSSSILYGYSSKFFNALQLHLPVLNCSTVTDPPRFTAGQLQLQLYLLQLQLQLYLLRYSYSSNYIYCCTATAPIIIPFLQQSFNGCQLPSALLNVYSFGHRSSGFLTCIIWQQLSIALTTGPMVGQSSKNWGYLLPQLQWLSSII
jgi:hypothetical protein